MPKRGKQNNKRSAPALGCGPSDAIRGRKAQVDKRQSPVKKFINWISTHRIGAGLIATAVLVGTASAVRYLEEAASVSSPHVSKGSTNWLNAINPFASAPPTSPTLLAQAHILGEVRPLHRPRDRGKRR